MVTQYWSWLDRAGLKTIDWLTCRYPGDRVIEWYRHNGYAVDTLDQVYALPRVVVEERASRLRIYWRRWLYGESAAVLFAGPVGVVVGGPILAGILFAWSIEMGFAYGLDMTDPLRIDELRRTIHHQLLRALGLPTGRCSNLTGWGRLVGTLLFWGFGPELTASDAVMAEIREQFRRQWEASRSSHEGRDSPADSYCSRRILDR